jgi:hypothetical protein
MKGTPRQRYFVFVVGLALNAALLIQVPRMAIGPGRIERDMTRYKKSKPEFFAGYRAARVIVDRGGSGGAAPTPPAAPSGPAK